MKNKHVVVAVLLLIGAGVDSSNIFDYEYQASLDISFKQVCDYIL